MEINIKLLKYHIHILEKIKNLILSELAYCPLYEGCITLIDAVLAESGIFVIPFLEKLHTHQYISLVDAYFVCIKKLKEELLVYLRKNKSSTSELAKLICGLTSNIYEIIPTNHEYCEDCGGFLIRNRNEMYCQKCETFQGKIYLTRDEELDDDIKQNKTNISKHFDVSLNRIYGIIDSKSVLPACALTQLRAKLDSYGFDITKQVHYSFALINQLKSIKSIKCTCEKGVHEIASQKKQVNYIISKIYPELTIPRLNRLEYIATKNTFLIISAASQQLFPGKYSNNYQYTLHRILSMNYPNREHILELLRYIYPQKCGSFETKDDKLKKINEVVKCFKEFVPIPQNIYWDISNYRVGRRYSVF